MGAIITTIIKYSFYTAVGVTATAGCITYFNKPDEASFHKYLNKKISERKSSSGLIESVGRKVLVGAAIKLSTIEIRDCVFFRVGQVQLGDRTSVYLGIVNNWVEM